MAEITVTESDYYCPAPWMEMELADNKNVIVIFYQTPEVKSNSHGSSGAASFVGRTSDSQCHGAALNCP